MVGDQSKTAHTFESFFHSSSEGLALVNDQGIIELTNHAFQSIFGYTESEMEGMAVESLIPQEFREGHHSHREEYRKAPSKRAMGKNRDLVALRKDGSKVPVEISLSPVIMGDVRKVAVMISNITERREMQMRLKELNAELQQRVEEQTRDLRESQNLYSLIAQNFPNGMISVFNRDLEYVFVEGQELGKLGIHSQALQGTSYLARLPDEVRDRVSTELKAAFENGGAQFEVELNEQIYEMTAVPLVKRGGETVQILVVERNVTLERRAKEEMQKSLDKERELGELKSRFVSMASHEFRTPLTTINSSAQLIGKYVAEEDQVKRQKHIDRIQGSVQHLTGILNDILSLGKLEEGKINVKAQDLDLGEFYQGLEDEMQLLAADKVDINIEAPDCESHVVLMDPNLLRTILVNLISNAIKYSPNGGQVSVRSVCTDEWLTVDVEDQGIGIPEEDQGKLFQRFYRASNVTNIEGTGLGLNIVQRLIQLLNGRLSFVSTPNEATIFTVNIPVHGTRDTSH